MRIFSLLIILLFLPKLSLASAIAPAITKVAISGTLPEKGQPYSVNVALAEESGGFEELSFTISDKLISISRSEISHYTGVNLHDIDIVVGRDTWADGGNLVVGPFSILNVVIGTDVECRGGIVSVLIEIDTHTYKSSVSDKCADNF